MSDVEAAAPAEEAAAPAAPEGAAEPSAEAEKAAAVEAEAAPAESSASAAAAEPAAPAETSAAAAASTAAATAPAAAVGSAPAASSYGHLPPPPAPPDWDHAAYGDSADALALAALSAGGELFAGGRDQSGATEGVGFLVPNDRVPRVIGKQGTGLRQIREASGQKVEARPEEDPIAGEFAGSSGAACRLSLNGSPEQIVVAFSVAVTRAFGDEPNCLASIRIPAEWAGRAIGRGGENLKKARMYYGVTVNVSRDKVQHPMTKAEERSVTLQGPTDKLGLALAILLGCADGDSNAGGGKGGYAGGGKGGYASSGGGGGGCGSRSYEPFTPTSSGMSSLASSVAALVPPPATVPGQVAPTANMGPYAPAGRSAFGPDSEEEAHLQLAVADSMAGAVLGRGGYKIKETMNMSGARIRMTSRVDGTDEPRRICIGGPLECAIVAQSILNEQLSQAYVEAGHPEPTGFAITLLVRKEACGAIIGRQGSGISMFREQTGCRIVISDHEVEPGMRPCQLEGIFQNVMQAERMIWEVVKQVPIAGTYSPPGYGIDGGHATPMKRGPPDGPVGSYPYSQYGETSSPAWQAPKRRRFDEEAGIEDPDSESKLLIPDQCAGLVIGKMGGNLKAIRENFGVRVEVIPADRAPHWVGERLVIIRGPAGGRAGAMENILRGIQQHSSQTGEMATFKMLIPTPKVGNVVGENGSSLRWMQETYGVQTAVGNEDILGDTIYIVQGQPGAVVEVAKQTVGMLDSGAADMQQPAAPAPAVQGEQQHYSAPQQPPQQPPQQSSQFGSSPVPYSNQYSQYGNGQPGMHQQPQQQQPPMQQGYGGYPSPGSGMPPQGDSQQQYAQQHYGSPPQQYPPQQYPPAEYGAGQSGAQMQQGGMGYGYAGAGMPQQAPQYPPQQQYSQGQAGYQYGHMA